MVAYGLNELLQHVATAGPAGFALQNATPNIWTWTAPNDGQIHTIMLMAWLTVTSNETGGAVNLTYTAPDGTVVTHNSFAAGTAIGTATDFVGRQVKAGTTVAFVQTALSGGAATVYADLWAQ